MTSTGDGVFRSSTATISDALDRLGRDGSLLGIAPLAEGQRFQGRAYTVRYVAAGDPPGTVGDYLDAVEPGQVVVLDNGGRLDATVWGDILTAMAHTKGIAATVIDGVNRDVAKALELGYPVYSRGRFMRTGKDRVEVVAEQVPVTIGGVKVSPGDLLVGDDDGVVRIPRDIEDEVFRLATEIDEREDAILSAVLSGVSITEARAAQGYHTLQRKGR
ncbi:RraA family protein [Agromyces archimandritae]|uniref:Putative 4-hydroxy-4-methyl-2-oxoglutarate aldolase n=1 Tax=Agromyces archimandritae TaxID=2781962 RepID=A0A975FLP3_9MICO|nr:RraA family protein [Agromyces archimandritae]QTX04404.1 RraA family protein [Agromyces archimandritae]